MCIRDSNFDERIEQKIFHCEIVVDNEIVKAETARYKKIQQITDFTDENGTDVYKRQDLSDIRR